MSGTQQAGSKICKLCGQDCSTRPRIKDKTGRYFCRDCYEKAIEKKKSAGDAPPISPSIDADSDGGVDWASEMLGMEAAAPAVSGGLHACPKCNAPLGAGVVLCTQCGYNSKTGKRSAAAVAEPVAAARKSSSSGTGGGAPEFLKNPWFIFVAVTGFFFGLTALSSGNEQMSLLTEVFKGLFDLAIWIVVLVCAFKTGIGTGFLSLCLLPYQIYFAFAVNDNAIIKALYGVFLVNFVVSWATGMREIMSFQ